MNDKGECKPGKGRKSVCGVVTCSRSMPRDYGRLWEAMGGYGRLWEILLGWAKGGAAPCPAPARPAMLQRGPVV